MITTENSPSDFKHPKTGTGYDGVVRIGVENNYGSGSLLYTGIHILTAAHVLTLDGETVNPKDISIQFDTATGRTTLSAQQILIHPNYQLASSNYDLALITLAQTAPNNADRYTLYRDNQEASATATLVGYGRQGTGLTGEKTTVNQRSKAQNKLEMTAGELEAALGYQLTWQPDADTILVADFDKGSRSYDTLGQITGRPNVGVGIYEGLIASGDSGGPAFINQKLAGVASYISSLSYPKTDIDTQANSSYGELGFWQRVSSYQEWIDTSIRKQYETSHLLNPETKKPDTEKVAQPLVEGRDSWAFFLLQFANNAYSNEAVSVDYSTLDGTALAGEDYIAVTGTLTLYLGENYAWIPVEIINDKQQEPDEVFYLTVYNPQGVTFEDNQTQLIAQRTIIDNDGWF